jgi:hypothetical protein
MITIDDSKGIRLKLQIVGVTFIIVIVRLGHLNSTGIVHDNHQMIIEIFL